MDRYINVINSLVDIKTNPYFVKLLDSKNVDLNKFIKTQKMFAIAVDHWSKILGKMVDKVPSYKERIVLIRNLSDEHGDGIIENSHVCTFNRFIESLEKIKPYDKVVPTEPDNPAEMFNLELNNMARDESWIFCVAALGTIEYMYISISKMINTYVSNFIKSDKIEHYSLHETLDTKHADELFSIIGPRVDIDNFTDIIDGIMFGTSIFNSLYKGLNNFLGDNNF